MPIVHLARKPPRWLRVALAALLLAFAVNSIAHVAHRHDASAVSVTHSLACGYCVSFGGLADTPTHHGPSCVREQAGFRPDAVLRVSLPSSPDTCAQPRAPPCP
jgi:hypothetical protein